jgi:hypothetical protein
MEDKTIGDLIDETVGGMILVGLHEGWRGCSEESVKARFRAIASNLVAECLGIKPSYMEAPYILQQ